MEKPRNRNGQFSRKGKRRGSILPKNVLLDIINLFYEGKSVRAIARAVKVPDKNNNPKLLSKTAVHKIVSAISI
jgi:hypothetical protein